MDAVLEEPFDSLFSSYKIDLKTKIRGSDLVFDCVDLLFYKCNKINLNHGGSCIDSAN